MNELLSASSFKFEDDEPQGKLLSADSFKFEDDEPQGKLLSADSFKFEDDEAKPPEEHQDGKSLDLANVPRGFSPTIDMVNNVVETAQRRAEEEPKFKTSKGRKTTMVPNGSLATPGYNSIERDTVGVDEITDTQGNVAKRGDLIGVNHKDGTSRLYEFSGDDENGHPTFRRLTDEEAKDKTAKASMRGDVFDRMLREKRIGLDDSLSGRARLEWQAKTGQVGRGDAFVFSSVAPFNGAEDENAERIQRMKDFADGKPHLRYRIVGGRRVTPEQAVLGESMVSNPDETVLDAMWADEARYLGIGANDAKRGKDETRKDYRKRLQDLLGERFKNAVLAQEEARIGLEGMKDREGALDTILIGGLPSVKYAAEFAISGAAMKIGEGAKLGFDILTKPGLMRLFTKEGAKQFVKVSAKHVASDVVKAAPVTVANAPTAYNDLVRDEYGVNQYGDIVVASRGDERGLKTALKATGATLTENYLENAVGTITKPLSRKLFRSFRKLGPVGRAVSRIYEHYDRLSNRTGFGDVLFEELPEENVQYFFNDVLGWGKRDSEFNGVWNEWNKAFSDGGQYTLKGQANTALAMLLQMGGQAALAGGKHGFERINAKRDIGNQLEARGIPKEWLKSMSLEQRNALGHFWNVFHDNPDKLKTALEKYGGFVGAHADEMVKQTTMKLEDNIRGYGVDPIRFTFQSETGADGKPHPKFNKVYKEDPLTGEWTFRNEMSDPKSGVTIAETDDGYEVIDDINLGHSAEVSSFDEAKHLAHVFAMQNQKQNLDYARKQEYMLQLLKTKVKRKAIGFKSVSDMYRFFKNASKEGGIGGITDVRQLFVTDNNGNVVVPLIPRGGRTAGAFALPDGSGVAVILDNIKDSVDMMRALSHESGHASGKADEKARLDFLKRADPDSEYGQILESLRRRNDEIGGRYSDDYIVGEAFSKWLEQRGHNPTIMQRIHAATLGKFGKVGDAELEVLANQIERESENGAPGVSENLEDRIYWVDGGYGPQRVEVPSEGEYLGSKPDEKPFITADLSSASAETSTPTETNENAPTSVPQETKPTSQAEAKKSVEGEKTAPVTPTKSKADEIEERVAAGRKKRDDDAVAANQATANTNPSGRSFDGKDDLRSNEKIGDQSVLKNGAIVQVVGQTKDGRNKVHFVQTKHFTTDYGKTWNAGLKDGATIESKDVDDDALNENDPRANVNVIAWENDDRKNPGLNERHKKAIEDYRNGDEHALDNFYYEAELVGENDVVWHLRERSAENATTSVPNGKKNRYLAEVGDNLTTVSDEEFAKVATEEELDKAIELYRKAKAAGFEGPDAEVHQEFINTVARNAKKKASKEAGAANDDNRVVETAQDVASNRSEEEQAALSDVMDVSGLDTGTKFEPNGDFLSKMSSDDRPIVRLNPHKLDTSDKYQPNIKGGANRNTGITTELPGEYQPSMAGTIMVRMVKERNDDGNVVLDDNGKPKWVATVITGRHRTDMARRHNKPIYGRVFWEDEMTKEQASVVDAVANIHDEKGSINDYIKFLDNIKPTREQAEQAGILGGKGLVAWSIYADATEAVRRATALDGSPEEGQISPNEATAIAEAAPRGAHERNAFIQSVLLRSAQAGMKGKAFVGYCKEMTRQLQSSAVNKNLLVGEQMDLFQDENFLAMEALTKRRNEYRTRKSNQYAEVASGIRAALNREGKLQITEEFAKDLGITDKTDRKQLEKAYDTATERAKYWDPSGDRMLTEEDVAAMDAEINAKADASAKKREELKAKLDAVKSGKPLPKKTASKKETTNPKPAEKTVKQHKSIAGHDKVFSAMTEAQRDYFDKQKSVTEDNLSSAELNDNGSVTFKTNDGFVLTINDRGTAEGGYEEKKGATTEKSSAVEKPPTTRKRTVVMKNADEEKKADDALAVIEFDTKDLRPRQTELSGGTSRNQNPSGNEYGKKWGFFRQGTRNVDIGAGRFDRATKFLADLGVTNLPFDPVNRNPATNERVANEVRKNPADTATVHNVLNVIDNDEVVDGIVNQAARAIKPTGKAIFTIYEGDKSGMPKKTRDGFQRNAKAASYLPSINKYFGRSEVHGNVIVASSPKDVGKAFWAYDNTFLNGIDWDTDFDYAKFGKLVTGVGKLVDILTKNGYKDFKSLATFISESDVNKYEKAKTVLQDVWNAVARQKGLERISDTQAKEIYDIIDKEVDNGRTTGNNQRLDASDGGSLGGVSPTNDAQSTAKEAARGESVRGVEEGSGTTVQGTGGGSGRSLGDDQGGRDNPSGRGYRGGRPGESGTDSGTNRRDDRQAVPVQRGEIQGEQRSASNGVDVGTQRNESGLDAGRSEHGNVGGASEGRTENASASVKRAAKKAVEKTGPVYTDFVMTPAVEEAILERSPIKRVRNNVAAIKLLQELKERDFKATPSEQEVLAKYVGWGGLSEMFSWDYEQAWEAENRGDAEGAKDYAKDVKYGIEGYEAYKEIRQILNDDEYTAAKRTVLTAFYTPIQMVRIEHEALRKLGVVGGRFLGPSAGVGNYASAAGNYAKGANWQFVEKDQISGQILRALFPNQRVHIGGYEETNLADSFFDFAIDNVPYADVNITDKKIGKYSYKIHDYFFAKTLSKVRPGGIIMFLTSTGTLDKTDGKLRQFLSQHGGKIVGAVRLPNGFFSKNAGTDVASDLVIIQRVNGEADNTGFMEQQKYGTDTEYVRRQGRVQVDLTYNKYFADNPGQVIGEMKVGSGQYGRVMLEYKMPSGDMFAKVSEAIDNALSGIDRDALMKSAPAIEQKDHTPVYDSEGLRQGNITLKGDKLYEKSGDELVEVEMPKLSAAQKKNFAKKMLSPKKIVEKIIGVRKVLRSVVDAEVNGMDDEHLQPLIDNLNEVYDDFVKRVGTFHDKAVTPFIMLDKADGNRLMTMEKPTKIDGKDVIEKADILKKRVIFTYQRPTKADTLADALTIAYSEYGYIRWDRIGELMGIPKDDVGKRLVDEGLAFENPQTGIHEPYWEYLSGHVRRKLEAARAAMQNDPAFAKNVEALEKVQPKDVLLDEVTIKFGNTWVDPAAMIDFLKEVYDIRGYQDVKLTKNDTVGKWNLELPRSSVEPFGTISFTQEHFLQAILNSESLEVRAKDPITNKYYVLERETEAQKLAAEKLHEAFARFLRTSEKWYEPSSKSFNFAMNDNVAMVLPNNILPFRAAGMSEDVIKKLHAEGREYQPAVIARGVLGGKSLCLAHCVGAGKTLEMQSIGMIGRHLGMFKKSMYVVPNHMLDQFCNEFLAAFPNANILKMSTEDVRPKNRRAFFAKVANGDWDAIVVKHSTFSKKLPMTKEWQKDYLEREVRRLTEAKMAAKGDKASAKDIEKMIVRANEKIKKLDNSDEKDNEIVPFEELGVDQLFVDEAHNFKGLPVVSSQARKVKGLEQGDSQRALDMEMKTQYVHSLHNGRRGVVFATGTPLSNAPVVEAYVNLRYLAPWALEEQGINSFDDFVNAFGRIETESEFGIDGKSTKEVQRVTAFVNIPEMMRLFRSVVDIVNSDQIKVKRPKMVMEAVPVQMSDAQAAIMEMVARESAIPPTKEERSKFLTLSGIAKRACISPRLLGIDDDGNKMIACANKVKQVFDETSDVRGAQLIFTDIFNSSNADGVEKYVGGIDGLERSRKAWNLNVHLKNMLVRLGIPEEQIGIIHDIDKAKGGDEGKDAAKEALFAKVRSGEVRVLIGSRPRMGEGTNVQDRLAAIHLLHPGWKPSEDTQAIGRIIRPGNMFETGKVFYYLTQGNKNIGSYETKNHELIGVKDRLIQAVMHGDETIREIDLDETSAERDMLMGLASANQDLIKLIDVRRVLHKAELNVESVGFSARSNADNATRTERALEKAKEDFAEQERGAKEWREKNADGSFVLTVPDGRKLESMKDMSEYISLQVAKQLKEDRYDRDERLEIGNFNGVPLILSCTFADNKIHLSVPSLGYAKEINYSGFIADFSPQAMTAFKGRILNEVSPDMEDAHKQMIADTENRIKRLKADAARFNEEWQKEKEKLTKLRAERARLERAVTPLIVQTTKDHKYSAYGNWTITQNGKTYNAIRQTDRKEVSAPSVKALLPMMDAEDFSLPGQSANKTIDLAPLLENRGDERSMSIDSIAADEVDFDTDLNPPDFKRDRRFDVVDNGALHENAIRHFSRKGAEGYIRSGKSRFSKDASVYESGVWQKRQKNAIISRREKQIRAIDRQSPLALRKAGAAVATAIRHGLFDETSKNAITRLARAIGFGYERNSESIARVRESDLFGVRGTDVNGWTTYSDGTVVIPLEGDTKSSLKNILALNQVFPNTWRFDGFGSYKGKPYIVAHTDKVGTPIKADVTTKHKFLSDNGFAKPQVYDQMLANGADYWIKDRIVVDANNLVLGRTSDGEVFAYNTPMTISAYELETGNAGVDFDTQFNISVDDASTDPAAKAYLDALNRHDANERTTLLAPNGKRSNLTNALYHLVRTKRFKDWFGDWENDAANASKVVDENGEPLPVYHGGAKGFNVFDNAKSRFSNPENSPEQNLNTVTPYGWFADAKKYADVFGRNGETKAAFIDIRNPLIISSWSELEEWADKAVEYRKRLRLPDLPTRGLKLREYLKDEFGYDGIIMKDTDTDGHLGGVDKKSFYVPFGKSPSQIKSADPVTYDDNSNVIPLSQRFNADNDNINWDTELTPEEAAYAESEDKTPTEKVMREVFGMTNEDIETAMRAAKMEPPRHEKKPDSKTWEQAEVLLSRPEYMVKLSRAVYKVGRPITDYENLALNVFFRERQEKVDRLTELLNEIMAMPKEALADPETAQMLKETKSDLANARQLMYETGVAIHQAASEQGRALRSNRGLLDKHDLTFAGILGQIASDIGGMNRITAEMDARIKEISQEFNKLDEDGREIATARLKAFSEKVITDIKNGGRVRRASEKMVGDESKRVHRNYLDALAQIEVHAAEAGDTLIGLVDQMYPSWGRWLKYLGEYHCFMNPEISEEDCIKAIVEDIQPFLSGIDENQVRDMLTGFGHNYRQSRYDSQRLMNDLRAQARMKRQLDYMNENNQLPPTTGMIRDELSQTARQLAREVQERKKEVDETNGGANRLKGALAAAKTRVKNRIEDLQRAIDSGEKIPGRERTVREDAELRQLKERKDSLQAIYDKMFKTSNGVTDEQRIRMVEKALSKELERTMVDYSRAINGDFSKRQKRPSVTSATAEELRRKISETRSAILELKKASYEFGLTPEEIAARNAKKIAAREAAIIRMAERIEKGDLRPMKKVQPPMPADLQKRYDEMGRQLKLAHQKLADMRLDAQNATIPKWRRRTSEYAKFLMASQRALMATMDFSATLRQAARISLGHPKIALKSFKNAIRSMFSDIRLAKINDEIMADPYILEAVEKYGLHMRDIDAENGRDVEMFHGIERNRITFFGKKIAITDIPLFGKLMLMSERHYITYLNSVSAELYTALVNDKTRFPDGPTPWQKKIICDMINMWNGSGALSKERRNAILKSGLNEIFWAPGLAISRIQTSFGYDVWAPLVSKGIANEHGGYDAPNAEERKTMAKLGLAEHVKSTLAMIALGALIKALTADDDDWYQFSKADWFEKLLMLASPKIGSTTIDFTGGERSIYELIHTIVTGRKRTSTGKVQKLGDGYGVPDAVEIVQRFMEGKWAPWLSEAFALYSGRDFTGQQYGLMQFLKNKIPLSLTDIWEQINMNGIGTSLLTVPLTLFGAGGATYDRKPYENAVNPFLAAKKEYDAIVADETLTEEEREAKLSEMRNDNPLMRDEVREDIAAELTEIRKNESLAKRMEKKGEEPDAELNEQIEQDKRNVFEKIRKYRW